MLRIAVVEDDPQFSAELKAYINRWCGENGNAAEISVFCDGLDIAEDYRALWDIIFMDIEMPHLDGMEAAKLIRAKDPDVIIIFVTTMAQYAIKGYEVQALDFVLKPVNYTQLSFRMDKAVQLKLRDTDKSIVVPDGETKIRLPVREILYIEVRNHTIEIVTAPKTYAMRGTLSDMEARLEGCNFSKCNQCYLVNLRNVTGVKKDSVIAGDRELPISRPRKKQFLEELSAYLGVAL